MRMRSKPRAAPRSAIPKARKPLRKTGIGSVSGPLVASSCLAVRQMSGPQPVPGPRRGGPMTKADIVDQISERTGLTKKDVAETVDSFLNAVARALANGH